MSLAKVRVNMERDFSHVSGMKGVLQENSNRPGLLILCYLCFLRFDKLNGFTKTRLCRGRYVPVIPALFAAQTPRALWQ
jgi:hypothetical protein